VWIVVTCGGEPPRVTGGAGHEGSGGDFEGYGREAQVVSAFREMTHFSVLWVAGEDVIAGGWEMVILDNGERVAVRKLI